jgi:hypothetical protein
MRPGQVKAFDDGKEGIDQRLLLDAMELGPMKLDAMELGVRVLLATPLVLPMSPVIISPLIVSPAILSSFILGSVFPSQTIDLVTAPSIRQAGLHSGGQRAPWAPPSTVIITAAS